MALKIDWSRFKKVGHDKTHTTLQHEDGHELRIAHGALSHQHRKELSKIPVKMTKGGTLTEEDIMEAKKQTDEYNKTHEDSPSDYPKEVEESISKSHHGKIKMADGGKVDGQLDPQSKLAQAFASIRGSINGSDGKSKPKPSLYADGGDVYSEGGDINKNKSNTDQAMESMRRAFGGGDQSKKLPVKKYADGGKVGKIERERADQAAEGIFSRPDGVGQEVPPPEQNASTEQQSSLDPALMSQLGITPEMMAQSGAPTLTSSHADNSSSQSPQMGTEPMPSAMGQPQGQQIAPGSAPQDQQAPAGPSQGLGQAATAPQQPAGPPDMMHGYQQQQAAIQNQSNAEAQSAKTQANLLEDHAEAMNDVLQKYQTSHKDIDDEVRNFQQDIVNGHIDPNKYLGSMDTGSKIQTGIALALGGLGGALHGGGNQAMDFINKQIDRDIDAQKADLGKKETLLSAAMRKYGNLQDATNMTKLMMMAGVQTGVQAAQAKSNSQVALARGQQMAGALESQMAPLIQQSALRSMLNDSGQQKLMSSKGGNAKAQLIKEDPAQFVAALVPSDKQKEVTEQIDRAVNTHHMAVPILKAFDAAADSMSGFGRLASTVKTPRELNALQSLLNTTVTDLTGTARQAEFDSIHDNLLPNKYDDAADKAAKRQALVQYLQAKASSSAAKSYGIDLEKFEKTALLPESRLDDKSKMMLQLARQNPEHPKAQLIFKKLGITE